MQHRVCNTVQYNRTIDYGFKKGIIPVTKGKHLSIEQRRILSESAKKRIGALNHFYGKHHTDITKKIISEKSKERMKDINYKERILKKAMSARGTKPNNKEKEVNVLLNKIVPNKFRYVGNGYTFIGGLNPDFINFKEKLIIEFFGCYIHACSMCYPNIKVREKSTMPYRNKHFSKYGYTTLFIWEHELKDKEKLSKRIEGFLNENHFNKSRQPILDKF